MIQTSIDTGNITIRSSICLALDKAIYGSGEATPYQISKSQLYRAELLFAIQAHSDVLADKLRDRPLYYLFCMLQRIRIDEGEHVNERMHANAHTAHEQLKNWK